MQLLYHTDSFSILQRPAQLRESRDYAKRIKYGIHLRYNFDMVS